MFRGYIYIERTVREWEVSVLRSGSERTLPASVVSAAYIEPPMLRKLQYGRYKVGSPRFCNIMSISG
jgi:hypothetical protein